MMRRCLLHFEGANIKAGVAAGEGDAQETSPALVERRVHTCSSRMSGRCCAVEAAGDRQSIAGVTSYEHLLIIDADGKADAVGNAAGVNDVEACLRVIDIAIEARHINRGIKRWAAHQQSMREGRAAGILQWAKSGIGYSDQIA